MLIKFDDIQQTVSHSFYNGEKDFKARIFNDSENKILRGVLEPGASIGLHTHKTNSEIIYILKGSGKVLYDDGQEALCAGDCHYCPMGHSHSLVNDSSEELVFFAVIPEHI